MMQRVISLFLVVALSSASAWVAPASPTCTRTPSSTLLQAHTASSRADFLKRVVATAGTAAFVGSTTGSQPAWAVVETLANGVSYEVLKKGNGLKADVGELIAIRFAAYNGPVKMDDIFETPEPYYTRLGSGGLIQGVEQTLPLMSLGDRWKLTIPGNLAFGEKGRPPSPGKGRIPPNAEIVFDVEIVGLPGKEPELIELIGDV